MIKFIEMISGTNIYTGRRPVLAKYQFSPSKCYLEDHTQFFRQFFVESYINFNGNRKATDTMARTGNWRELVACQYNKNTIPAPDDVADSITGLLPREINVGSFCCLNGIP